MLLHRNPLAKIACLLLLPVLLLLPRPKLAAGVLQLTVFDVGQGLAILISTRNQQLLYDTGPRYSPTFDAGSDVLIPVLRRAGVTRLDHVIVSHGDADHAGGVPAIEVAFPAAHFMAPDIGIFSAPIEAQSCQDQQWTTNGATFTVLHPDASTYSSNNSSCVLLVDTGSIQVLLPGDIEREVELALLDRYPGLQADILIAPHHGSKTSSSYPFIKTLRPSHVIFSAGFHNRFGHPALEVQQRYNTLGVAALNTAYSGAISITIERELGITEISEYRRMRRRFWYQLP